VEYTCDHVVVMDKGQVATDGPIDELKGRPDTVYELRIKGDLPGFLEALARQGMEAHGTDQDVMRVFVPDVLGNHQAIFKAAAAFGRAGTAPAPDLPTLEDVLREGGRRRVARAVSPAPTPCRFTIKAIVTMEG
jgi:ABC-type glutathione transport system ATPase component